MNKGVMLGLILWATSLQAQNVSVTVGKTYTIPYVINQPGVFSVGQQVKATHNDGLLLGLASNVVVPTDTLTGAFSTYADHYNPADGLYSFVALMWAAPADAGVLPIRVLARRAGTYELKVRQCTSIGKFGIPPACVDSITYITATGESIVTPELRFPQQRLLLR